MTDLSLVFTLTPSAETKLPPMPSRILHGAFLHWLERDHPELVKQLHDNNERRPYTLSDLHGKFEEKNGWRKLLPGQTYWYRLTTMGPEFIQYLLSSMRQQPAGPQPDDPKLVPGPVFISPEEHPYASLSSFAQIIEGVLQQSQRRELSPTVTLRFESPACFIENKQALPLPVPRCFGYLADGGLPARRRCPWRTCSILWRAFISLLPALKRR
jgi:CRISPR-associated endoribonuclease Cas6